MKTRLLLFIFFFTLSLSIKAQSASDWYEQGMDEGNLTEKLKCFDNAIREDPEYADAYFQKAIIYLKQLKEKEAIAQFSTAIGINPKKEFLEGRGDAYFQIKKYNDALNDYVEALKSNAQNRKIILKKALTYNELSKYGEAIQDFDNILKIEPLNSAALAGKGRAYNGIGKTGEAISILNELIKREPNNEEAIFNLGRCFELNNDSTNAISYYKQILAFNKKNQKAQEAISRLRNNESQQPCIGCTPATSLPHLSSFKRKYGLCIGNSAYSEFNPLENKPINDAKVMNDLFTSFKIDSKLITNAGQSTFENAINTFIEQVENADVVFLFYAGHGIERDGLNYFVPTDASMPIDVKKYIQLQEVLERLQTKNVKYIIIIADACRSSERGLGALDSNPTKKVQISPKSPSNYLIGFATLSGKVAENGVGNNGIYTAALKKCFKKGERVDDILRKTRGEVQIISGKAQLPENTEGMSESLIID